MTMMAWSSAQGDGSTPGGARSRGARSGSRRWMKFTGLVLLLAGCNAFNPAFLDLVNGNNGTSFATLPNAPGHVVITLVNRTTIDEQLLNYLSSRVDMSEDELRAQTPRIRMRLRVTYIDGSFQTIEFVTGSQSLIDPQFDATAFPDLNQNDLSNVVVLCDVANVTVEPGTTVEVFIPVALQQWELVETNNPNGGVDQEFQPRDQIPPQFRVLLVDEVDGDGNVTLRQNIGIRDVPSPIPNVVCGSVVALTVDGVLSVPFLATSPRPDEPSFDINDEQTIGGIGGRYEFIATVR